MVVIGGGFGVAAFDLLLPSARLAVLTEALAPAGQALAIERAILGARAGLIGAGLVAFEGCLMPLAVCATPIGNLEDVTLRVLTELREADVVLAEDTRHTRGLLERHGISARLLSLHEHNEAARVAELAAAARGRRAAGARLRRRHAAASPTPARGSSGRRSMRAST